jgi:hypothetical protein
MKLGRESQKKKHKPPKQKKKINPEKKTGKKK